MVTHRRSVTRQANRQKGGRAADNRLFVEAVLYVARTGCPWRDLPCKFGHWHSVYVRFVRWEQGGAWARVAQALCSEADLEELFIDAMIVRAYQHAAWAPKKQSRSGNRSLLWRIEYQDPCLR